MESEHGSRGREGREIEQRASERESREAAEKGYQGKIIRTLEAIEHQTERANDENTPIKKSRRRWEKGGVIGLWAAAIAAIIAIWITSSDTNNSIIAANRAWLAPTRVELIAGVDDSGGPSVLVHYQNVGRSPALDVKIGMGPIAVDVAEPIKLTREYPKTALWEPLGKTFRQTCNKNEPVSSMGAVYPSAAIESSIPSKMTTGWNREKLLAGTQMIVVTACFAYRTMKIVGHSGFCNYIFHIAGRDPKSWEIRSCPVANYAE